MKIPLLPIALLSSAAAIAELPADVELQPVPGVSGLDAPLGLKHAGDGSGRIFIVEQGGTVRVIASDGGLRDQPFVELADRVATNANERGLLDIAFHPQFATNRRFYLHYSAGITRPPDTAVGDTIVAEFIDNEDPANPVTAPNRIILTVAQDFSNHNGGQMRFGPEGYLYLGLGDGGSGGDPCNRAQTLDPAQIETDGNCKDDPSVALLGKLLRLDLENSTPPGDNNLCAADSNGSANYAVPAENPFSGDPDACGEAFLYGLRNPWRWSFDRATGDLWIGDVGQNQWEEIDLLEAPLGGGENLGWNCFEASSTFSTGGACPPPSPVFPIIEYDHASTGGWSVTGGYRYRGPVRSLQGRYIYGDFCSGNIWFADDENGAWETLLTDFSVGTIRSFGEDQTGNVYVIANDQLHRFIGEEIFVDGFESP